MSQLLGFQNFTVAAATETQIVALGNYRVDAIELTLDNVTAGAGTRSIISMFSETALAAFTTRLWTGSFGPGSNLYLWLPLNIICPRGQLIASVITPVGVGPMQGFFCVYGEIYP